MIRSFNQNKFILILLFALSFAFYSSNISGVSIYILDEAKNTECAREMFQRHDLVVPTFNDVLRTDKPPLHYFFMMIAYALFGVNAFAARFFSALLGALTIIITCLFTCKHTSRQTALLTAVILLASIHLSIQFHLAVPDPYLIFFFTCGLIFFYESVLHPCWKYRLPLYVSIGLGTLAKGPVAIGLSGLVFLLFLIFSRRLNWIFLQKLRPFTGALIVLLIALPWYILAHLKTNGAFTEGFFLKNNINRFAGEMEGHGGSFLRTILFVLLGMFPFSVFIVQTLRKAWKNRRDDFILFNLLAAGCVIIFFACSRTKLPNYTVPAYPFLAILLGIYLQTVKDKQSNPKVSMWIYLIISLLMVPGVFIALMTNPSLAAASNAGWFFIPLPLLALLSFYFWQKRQTYRSLFAMGASGVLTAVIFFCLVFPKIDRQNPVVKSIPFIQGKELRYFGHLNAAFPFNLKQVIPPIRTAQFENFFINHPHGVIITEKRQLKKVHIAGDIQPVFVGKDIFGKYTTVLLVRKDEPFPLNHQSITAETK